MATVRLRCGAIGLLMAAMRPCAAQIPFHVFDEDTQVSSIGFRFTSSRSFSTTELTAQLGLSERGTFAGLKERLDFLPMVSAPDPHPFSPLELQRDVVRLRQFYGESGFIGTKVSYDVDFINSKNEVNIDYIIDEGRPVILRSLTITLPDGSDPSARVPADLQATWRRFVPKNNSFVGRRLTALDRTTIVGEVLDWWMDRGWAFAKATPDARVDSSTAALSLRVEIDPGPRAHVDSIDVIGNESVTRGLVLRTLPLKEGDWFSAAKLAEGQRRLFGLELFRVALAQVADSQPHDSTVTVRVRLEEAPPRLVTSEMGYLSAGGGAMGRAEFAHRNFTGGARTLRVSGIAQTGLMAAGGRPERLYQATVSFREPLFLDPRLSLTLAPFAIYRDNLTDRSQQGGLETSLIYSLGAYRYLTLQHRYTTKRVLDYRIGSGNAINLESLLGLAAEGALDNIDNRVQRSTLSLSGTFGRLDPTRQIAAVQVRPSIEMTAPPALNTIEYALVEAPITAYRPIGKRMAIAAHAQFGRVFPFGKTVAGDSIGVLEEIQLRDVLLNTGGTGTVRGWANGLLGPKLLNLHFQNVAGTDSIIATGTDGYIPAGGLARAAFGLELRLPFPGLSDTWGTHIFFEGGRVWTPDKRLIRADPNNEERWFYSAGAGVDLRTIVGPVRLSVGYKLNPSPLDLRDPARVFDALAQGLPLSSVPTAARTRIHLHLTLGQAF